MTLSGRSVTSLHVVGIAAVALALTVVLTGVPPITGLAAAQTTNTSNETNVSVNIAPKTEVSIDPAAYNFSEIEAGSSNFTDHADLQFIISNSGSTNITDIYAHLDTLESEPTNPLGTGNASKYAAGRFLWIKNETGSFYLAGSLSWNVTEQAGGTPNGISGESSPQTRANGYWRNATGDYLWALNSDSQYCNSTATDVNLDIKDEVDTGDNRDLGQNAVNYDLDAGGQNENWSMAQVSGGPLDGHYVGAWKDCNKLYITRYDDSTEFPSITSNDQFLVSDVLAPGSTHEGRVAAGIPEGVPAGDTNTTFLTVTATSNP